jgi:hypothetical protein
VKLHLSSEEENMDEDVCEQGGEENIGTYERHVMKFWMKSRN